MKLTNTPTFSRQGGFTLIEIIVVLVIAALLILGALRLFSSANDSADTNSQGQFIQSLMAKLPSFKDRGAYTGLTTQLVIDSGQFNDYKSADSTTLLAPNQSPVEITTASINGGRENAFTVTLGGFNKASCSGVGGVLVKNTLVRILSINGDAIHDLTNNQPGTSATVIGACTQDNDNSFTITGS